MDEEGHNLRDDIFLLIWFNLWRHRFVKEFKILRTSKKCIINHYETAVTHEFSLYEYNMGKLTKLKIKKL